MYTITIDGRPFYDPITPEMALESPVLTLEANKIGTLEFTIYPNHPEYENVNLLKSVLTVYRDGEIISKLRPAKRHLNFKRGIEWTCEELTGMLNDIHRRPTMTDYTGNERYYLDGLLTDYSTIRSTATPSGTVTYLSPYVCEHYCYAGCQMSHAGVMELLMWMVYFGYHDMYQPSEYTKFDKGTLRYNAPLARAVKRFQADEGLTVKDSFSPSDLVALRNKIADEHAQRPPIPADTEINMTFVVGDVTYVDGTESITHESMDYVGYWDLIQRELVENHDGAYIVPVWGETTCALNYVSEDDLPLSTQTIRFGENMADLFIDVDGENAFSVLIPFGANGTSTHGGKTTSGPISIESVNGGLDYLQDANALGTYGRKEIMKTWGDIKTPAELMQTAQAWFEENVMQMRECVSLSAYELRYAGVDVGYLTFMTRVPAESGLHGLRREYPLRRMEIALDSPTAINIELGDDPETLTDIAAESSVTLTKYVRPQGSYGVVTEDEEEETPGTDVELGGDKT